MFRHFLILVMINIAILLDGEEKNCFNGISIYRYKFT